MLLPTPLNRYNILRVIEKTQINANLFIARQIGFPLILHGT